jgi:hypothetical protein
VALTKEKEAIEWGGPEHATGRYGGDANGKLNNKKVILKILVFFIIFVSIFLEIKCFTTWQKFNLLLIKF